jgi:hypothetical protein
MKDNVYELKNPLTTTTPGGGCSSQELHLDSRVLDFMVHSGTLAPMTTQGFNTSIPLGTGCHLRTFQKL